MRKVQRRAISYIRTSPSGVKSTDTHIRVVLDRREAAEGLLRHLLIRPVLSLL